MHLCVYRVHLQSNRKAMDRALQWKFWSSIITFIISSFLGGIVVSILTPFYTKVAVHKGVNVSEAGVVFGMANIVEIIFTPIFGKYLGKYQAYRIFLIGLFICGVANILFGSLQWINDKVMFLALSVALRSISAIGEAAFMTSIYSLATRITSKNRQSTALSLIETFFGMGLITGPAIGGILYDQKGFYFPFLILGCVTLSLSIVSAIIFDAKYFAGNESDQTNLENNKLVAKNYDTTYGMFFAKPAIIASFIMFMLSELSNTWLYPTLEPFLSKSFGVKSTMSGIMFSIEGLTYATFSPIFGILLDRGISRYTVMIFGVVCRIVGLNILGPAPYLTFIPKSLYSTGAGLLILGSGIAASSIVTLTFMLEEVLSPQESIIYNTEQRRGMVTSIWLTAENLGGWSGSFLGGIAYENMDFEGVSLIVMILQVITVLAIPYLWYLNTVIQANRSNDAEYYQKLNTSKIETSCLIGKT